MSWTSSAVCYNPLRRVTKLLRWFALAFAVSGCVSAAVAPSSVEYERLGAAADEQSLWRRAEQEEDRLARNEKFLHDAPLDEYLRAVALRMLPVDARESEVFHVRVNVLRDPTLNAFAMPNGIVYVHTGLLARLDNEAQLAAILGRELAHVTGRHALAAERERKSREISRPRAAAASASPVYRALTSPVFPLAFEASVEGYGRTLEREADVTAVARMIDAGYDPSEAPRVYESLLRARSDSETVEPFLLGRRGELEERAEVARRLLATRYAQLDRGMLARPTEPFAQRMRVAVRENAALDVRAGHFQRARAELDRVLASEGNDAVALVYYGDLYRLQAQHVTDDRSAPLLLDRAREQYEKAAAIDPAYPVSFRQLGLLYYQSGQPEKASEAFRKYLTLEPDAPDARRIREYVTELDR
jgi:predicted Zn-dependent protease